MQHCYARPDDERVSWIASTPFIVIHLLPLAAFWTGVSLFDVLLCASLYVARMFFITAGYHRYFSHRAYRMGRVMQFIMAFGGGTAAQKGALWWAAHHRHHHRYSDQPEDIHSPMKGFWWSHVLWITCPKYEATELSAIKDLAKYPELLFLNRYHLIPPVMLGLACFLAGGWSALWIGFFLSTVLTYHGTFFINSLTHLFGRRRYVTSDTSRNSFLLSLLTFGEGWHNNHHYYQSSAQMGFFWWEIDMSFYILKVLSWLGLVRDLRTVPARVRSSHRLKEGYLDIGMFQAYWTKAVSSLTQARQRTSEYCDAQRVALDEMIESTRVAADRIARMPIDVPDESNV